jgi:HEAT repeat protein
MKIMFTPLLLTCYAASAFGNDGAPGELGHYEAEVIDTLRLLRDPSHPPIEDLVPSFTAAGRHVPGLLFDVLVQRSVPATGDVPAQRLSVFQRDLVVAGFEQLGRGFVYEALGDDLQDATDVAERRALIEVLGAIGTGDELMRVFDLALTAEEESPIRGLEEAFGNAATAILARDERAFQRLERSWRSQREELYSTLLTAVGNSDSPVALEYLAEVILWDEDLASAAMAQIPKLGKSADEHVNEELRMRLRHYLDPEQPGLCGAASLALAELEDLEALPYLIDLLASELASDGIKRNATWALQKISGLSLPQNARRWNHWYEGELDWMRRGKAKEFRRIMSHDERHVAKGLREIAKHPLVNEEFVHTLRAVLIDRNDDVRVLACQALAVYGDEHVMPWLVDALEDPYPEVRHAAWESLRKLTGLELTPLEWSRRSFAAGY